MAQAVFIECKGEACCAEAFSRCIERLSQQAAGCFLLCSQALLDVPNSPGLKLAGNDPPVHAQASRVRPLPRHHQGDWNNQATQVLPRPQKTVLSAKNRSILAPQTQSTHDEEVLLDD